MDTFCNNSIQIWQLLGKLFVVLKIAIPVIIVLLGTFDLGKAVFAGEDKEMKEAQKMFIKRIIYGIAIFFLPTIINTAFSMVKSNNLQEESKACWQCVTKVNGSECDKYVNEKSINDNNYFTSNNQNNEQENTID